MVFEAPPEALSSRPMTDAVGNPAPGHLPYRIAVLCDLRDEQGRILLLHRVKEPNKDLCSPIGGKLDIVSGESPAQCAKREILEEAGIDVPIDRLHLAGIISERAYEGRGHWLLFYYRVIGPVSVPAREIREGRLEWHRPEDLDALPMPETDRRIIWPLIRRHEATDTLLPGGRPALFALHIDCTDQGITWAVEQQAHAR